MARSTLTLRPEGLQKLLREERTKNKLLERQVEILWEIIGDREQQIKTWQAVVGDLHDKLNPPREGE